MIYSHVWGSHSAKFDDDDFNSFWGIACVGHTHTHTHTLQAPLIAPQNTHTEKGLVYINIFKVTYDFENKNLCPGNKKQQSSDLTLHGSYVY